MSLKSPLVPLAVIVLSFGQLVLAGRGATKTIAENLRNPLASSGLRIVDLVQWSPATARVHELTFTRPEIGPTLIGDRARLEVQLWSKGRTRILVLRPPGSGPSRWRAFLDVLRGRGRFLVVADRKWVDLGVLPSDGSPLAIQVAGLLPGPYGFAELKTPADPVFDEIRITHGVNPAAARDFPRYRITVPLPVDAKETLSRFFFFISISRVLQAAGLLALVLLSSGWWFLGKGRAALAVSSLIPSVVLLHAVCLPPLQGADETSHGATIEALLFRGMPVRDLDPYPASFSRAATWLEQDRVQYQPDEPLPLDGPETRVRLASQLGGRFEVENGEKGLEAPQAYVQGVNTRSPLYFRPFQPLGPLLRPIPLIERISAYRLLSALSGLILFGAGVWVLLRARLGTNVALSYGTVWLVPYMIFTVASTSNYAPAVGLGSLLSACGLVLVLSEGGREKAIAATLLVVGSWVGIPIWPDFIFLAPVATIAVAFGGLYVATSKLRPRSRWSLLIGFACLLLGAATLFAVTALRMKTANIGTRMPLEFPKSFDRNAFWMILAVAAPVVLASLSVLAIQWFSKLPTQQVRRVLARVSVSLAAILFAGFLLTPWTLIPYETDRYWFSKLAREHLKVFVSNSLAWDQDVLSWKFWVGAGGWHDLFLPDAVYAASRWIFIALLVLLPVAASKWISRHSTALSGLFLLAGLGATLCVASATLRYLGPANPFGRFVLPWFPLTLVPLTIFFVTPEAERSGTFMMRVGVLSSIWISVAVAGGRYFIGL